MKRQITLKDKIHFSGKGIHTGVFTNMTLIPAKENNGIVFVRKDKDNTRIKAIVENIYSTERSTNLKKNSVWSKKIRNWKSFSKFIISKVNWRKIWRIQKQF